MYKSGWQNDSTLHTVIDGNCYHTFPQISQYLSSANNGVTQDRIGCSSSTIAPLDSDHFTDGMGSFAVVMGLMLSGYLALRVGGNRAWADLHHSI